ncbi:MAG TPA: hypothetical protein VKA46_16545 [Gemmataceae bacterium]|nr:hypothetical protein [Gemmataceae bacterium]
MRIFFDRCAAVALARMVRGFEGSKVLIRHHDEDGRFTTTTADEVWISTLAADGDPLWLVISGDGRILRNKAQRAVLDGAKLPFFYLAKGWINRPIHEQAWKFMKVWPEILARARQGKGRIFEVTSGSSLKVDVIA